MVVLLDKAEGEGELGTEKVGLELYKVKSDHQVTMEESFFMSQLILLLEESRSLKQVHLQQNSIHQIFKRAAIGNTRTLECICNKGTTIAQLLNIIGIKKHGSEGEDT